MSDVLPCPRGDDDRQTHHLHLYGPIRINLHNDEQGQGFLAVIADLINDAKDEIMADLKNLQAAIAAQKTVIDGAITLLNGLAAKIAALPADQAAIDKLASDVSAETATLAAAVVADTGAPDVAPTVPVVQPAAVAPSE